MAGRGPAPDPADPDDLATDAELLATAPYCALIDCAVMMPSAATAGWAQAYSAASIGNRVITSAATQDAYLEWTVPLAAGTYSLKAWHAEDDDLGIASISIDGAAALGTTIDCYAAAPAVSETAVITGINIPTTGRHAIRLTAAPAPSGGGPLPCLRPGWNGPTNGPTSILGPIFTPPKMRKTP